MSPIIGGKPNEGISISFMETILEFESGVLMKSGISKALYKKITLKLSYCEDSTTMSSIRSLQMTKFGPKFYIAIVMS